MKTMFHFFDQQKLAVRVLIIAVLAVILVFVWFVSVHNVMMNKKTERLQNIALYNKEMSQLDNLEAHKDEILYKNDISLVAPQEVLSHLLSSVKGLTLAEFHNIGSTTIIVDNPAFSIIEKEYQIKLKGTLVIHEFVANFTGDYYGALEYLKTISDSKIPVFIESVDYEIVAPPKANISIKAFTLEDVSE